MLSVFGRTRSAAEAVFTASLRGDVHL